MAAYGADTGLQLYAYLKGRRIDGYVDEPRGGAHGQGGEPPGYDDGNLYENAEVRGSAPHRIYRPRDFQHEEEGDAFMDPPPAYPQQQGRIYNPRY